MKWKRDSTVLSALALILAGPVSCAKDAKHDHAAARDHSGGHGSASHHGAEAPVAARNFAEAVRQLQTRMASLDTIIKSGDYDGVHDDCVAIGKLGESLGALAATEASGVSKGKVSDVSAAGQELSTAARGLHKAAHNDQPATVKGEYARMVKLVESLGSLARQP